MEGPIGLIVKGRTALFLKGHDPGAAGALAVINRYRIGDSEGIPELNLKVVPRPGALSELSWQYGFFSIGDNRRLRLAAGPFDPELDELVKTMDRLPEAPNAEDLGLGDQGQSGG